MSLKSKTRSLFLLAAAVLAMASAPPAAANWLSRLGRVAEEAGEAGAKAGRHGGHGIAALDQAVAHLSRLPASPKGTLALAAHATPEGHWKFVNREGEAFTAANADEMSRIGSALGGGDDAASKLTLYISEDTIFDGRSLIKSLPDEAALNVVVDEVAYPVIKKAGASGDALLAKVGKNVVVEIEDRSVFREAVHQLGRTLNKSNMRVLALEPGGPKRLSSVPTFDKETKAALVDAIDPAALASALAPLRGQTAVIVARLEGDVATVLPAAGKELSIGLADLKTAAAEADVNLVVLQSATPRQPGGRNWFWQRIEVKGLADALRQTTFADFLDVVSAGRGQLTVGAVPDGVGRVALQAVPTGEASVPLVGGVGNWMTQLGDSIVGKLPIDAVQVFARDKERDTELDARFVPGIPSAIQITYLVNVLAGLVAYAVSWDWFGRLWPPEERTEYGSRFAHRAAGAARVLAYLLVFLPFAGGFAFVWTIMLQLWQMLTAPVRFFHWLKTRFFTRTV